MVITLQCCTIILLLHLAHEVGADDDDFADRLFSDLAPLLSLFGERFAQQFLSESFTWLDHIVFAMAPLGIITTLVGAIRVGGPIWLKALIGRARENVAEAETELMSSTSEEVCELFNGKSIVRTIGRPAVQQIIYLEALQNDGQTFGLYTLENAKSLLTPGELPQPYISGPKPHRPSDVEKAKDDASTSTDKASPRSEKAPNISLNLHGPGKSGELAIYALFGIVLQSGVLIISGLIIYHPYPELKIGDANSPSGFPLQAIGTTLLIIGMICCSMVIEQSTTEERWIVNQEEMDQVLVNKVAEKSGESAKEHGDLHHPKDLKTIHLFWVQKKHIAADQRFNPYLLAPKMSCEEVFTSHRLVNKASDTAGNKLNNEPNKYLENLTIVGVSFGLVGFVAQFQGFRLSHWTSPIFQLVAVLFMTILRAILRRGLTIAPAVLELPEEYELDDLALHIADDPDFIKNLNNINPEETEKHLYWRIRTPDHKTPNHVEKYNNFPSASEKWNPAQKAMEIRKRLGELTEWTGPFSEEAIIIAKAIEVIMENLVTVDRDEFFWRVKIKHNLTHGQDDESEPIRFSVKKENQKWTASSTEIEAALSLWNYYIWKDHQTRKSDRKVNDWLRDAKDEKFGTYHRVICEDKGAYEQDLTWWIGDMTSLKRPLEKNGQGDNESYWRDEFWYGVDGSNETERAGYDKQRNGDNSPGINRFTASTGWKLSLAHHLFSAFMWEVAEHIDTSKLKRTTVSSHTFDIDSPHTWDTLRLENPKLSEVVKEIQNLGLDSLEQVYYSIIPPLSYKNKLPNEAVVDYILQKVLHYEVGRRWTKASRAYTNLLDICENRSLADKFSNRAIAVSVEFLFQIISEPLAEDPERNEDHESIENVKTSLMEKLRENHPKALERLVRLYPRWPKKDRFEELFGKICPADLPNTYDYENSTDVLGRTELQYESLEFIRHDDCSYNQYWDSLCDISGGSGLDSAKWRLDMNHIDILGKNFLHHLFEEDYDGVFLFEDLEKHGLKVDIRARDGKSLLHRCSETEMSGDGEELLKTLKGKVNLGDNAGRTALHIAACRDDPDNVKLLLSNKADVKRQDNDGCTPLHFVLNEFTGKVILEWNGDILGMKDNNGRTPLHAAVQRNIFSVVKLFLKEPQLDMDPKDNYGETPLSMAVQNGNTEIVELLLESGGLRKSSDRNKLLGEGDNETTNNELQEPIRIDVNSQNINGDTPLLLAVKGKHKKLTAMLLDASGIDVNCSDKIYQTPIYVATILIDLESVKLLALKGANILGLRHRVPLPQAAAFNNREDMTKLLEAGSKPITGYDRDNQSLEETAARDRLELIKFLLCECAKSRDCWEQACQTLIKYHVEMVPILQQSGIDIDHTGKDGQTLLFRAIDRRRITKVRSLIKDGGATVDWVDDNGRTPLFQLIVDRIRTPFESSKKIDFEMAELLVEEGADINHEDKRGLSLKYLAKRGGLLKDEGWCQLLEVPMEDASQI